MRLSKTTRIEAIVIMSVAILALASGVIFIIHGRTEAIEASQPAVAGAIQSQFSFKGAPGWYKGPTNKTSMALFKADHECFTSIEHKTGTVDAATEIEKQQTMMARSGNAMMAGVTQTVNIQTSMGSQQFDLHEFSLSSGDKSHPLMGGLGLGYARLSDGHLYIQSHCNTAHELPTTIPALQAYEFN